MPRRILIVDDDLDTREGLALIVAGAGYHTLTVGNVPAAQQVIAAAPPDLLITDVRIGLSNGLQLLAMAPKPMPAIVITGFPDPSIEADARALGADFMLKPVSLPALLARITSKLAQVPPTTFPVGRRWVRRRLARPVPLQVNDARACIFEVSDRGVGLELQWGANGPFPSAITLGLDNLPIALPVAVAWARPQDDMTWICGGMIAEQALSQWQAILPTFI